MAVPRIGSLFSGSGQLDRAVEQITGGHVVWQCEIDPVASMVLEQHWPGVPNLGDIRRVNWSRVRWGRAEPGPVDVLCGGFPCTDISLAGARAGLAPGTQSGLWSEMVRAIDTLRPGQVIIENVRSLLRVPAERPALGDVLRSLADLGYDAEWETVSAAAVGADHFAATGSSSSLLPTPTASDAHRRAAHQGATGRNLITAILTAERSGDWARYQPAISRWESLTRPAPPATEINKLGGPRVHVPFVEWMVGWPQGWVTDSGISRSDQLWMIGNGVVPQQAAAALAALA